MANKDIFKQAIAEAKSVRESAIANAKEALEESLTPHLKDMLAAKLQEMEDKDVSEEEVNEMEDEMEEGQEMKDEVVAEDEMEDDMEDADDADDMEDDIEDDMGDEPMADEVEEPMDAGAPDTEDPAGYRAGPTMQENKDEIVKEVLRRVTKRILSNRK